MKPIVLIAAYVLMLALPAALAAAIITALICALLSGRRRRMLATVVAGSAVPAAMVAYGLILSWPWPWRQPDALQDMISAGPGLLVAALPSWLFCMAVSWVILRPRRDGDG